MTTLDERTFFDLLDGHAHSYAVDYLAWWIEGGREPDVDMYISEDDPAFSTHQAHIIAATIRAAYRP